MYTKKKLEDRFWEKVDKNGPIPKHRPELGPCWTWLGSFARRVYGDFSVDGHNVKAHRYAYELLVGPIPPGLQLDHLCRNRACVNPTHLEPVTHRENIMRGNAPSTVAVRTGYCQRGHGFTPENTMVAKTGKRKCRICHRARRRAYYYRHKSKN